MATICVPFHNPSTAKTDTGQYLATSNPDVVDGLVEYYDVILQIPLQKMKDDWNNPARHMDDSGQGPKRSVAVAIACPLARHGSSTRYTQAEVSSSK